MLRTTRMARNVAEKQRRDKLNSHINELANIVPLISNASKRLDKIAILRLSSVYMRLITSKFNSFIVSCALRKLAANFHRNSNDY